MKSCSAILRELLKKPWVEVLEKNVDRMSPEALGRIPTKLRNELKESVLITLWNKPLGRTPEEIMGGAPGESP